MIKFKYTALLFAAALAMTSCDDYLDTLPDDRAEINTQQKVRDLLTSAYPSITNDVVNELSSDNVTDNGSSYTSTPFKDEVYHFETVEAQSNDSPEQIWQGYYGSVATANQAMQAINEMGGAEAMPAEMAEAKLIRAFAMFQLANTFCMSWNEEKADEYLGLPYPESPETSVHVSYTRGTLRELFAKINQDIEDALPYIDESYYSVPKYHFNLKAAYAFAARFNLYYQKWDKVIEYANKVLGSDPTSVMRNFEYAASLQVTDMFNNYVSTSEQANLMLQTAYSTLGYYFIYPLYPRIGHSSTMSSYETYMAGGPWGSGSSTSNTIYYAGSVYNYGGLSCQAFYPSLYFFFEYTDKVAGTGYLHTVDPVFTGDETLLCRAEAYAHKGEYQKAVDDINTWITTHCKESAGSTVRPTMTIESVNEFIEGIDYAPVNLETNRDRTIRKTFNPQGFTVASGTQENLLQLILHMRRLETMFQGLRFNDVKRYGISYAHIVSKAEAIIFKAADLRGAIQLPNDVINAGLEANPR